MATANEELLDAVLRHQIGLLRFSGGLRNRVFEILDATEADLGAQIRRRLDGVRGLDRPASVRRMQRLVKVLSATRLTAWKDVTALWLSELSDLMVGESISAKNIVNTVSPVVLQTSLPPTGLLKSLARTQPFEGKILRDWAGTVRDADIDRISRQVQIGMVQGEPPRRIASRVVGTVRLKGADGVTEITRRQAAAITRTAVNAFSNQARRSFLRENSSVFSEEAYVATLDSRTTPICRALDGKRYPVGEGPIPPRHFNCRSTRVGVLNGEVLGKRPSKPTTERELLREYTEKNKLSGVSRRADLPYGTKGKFDQFSRARVRELTGRVPAKVNYQEWLGRQSYQFQNDVLGVNRARLFRDGKVPLDRFVDKSGRQYTLAELARRDRQAFLDAGLDPAGF